MYTLDEHTAKMNEIKQNLSDEGKVTSLLAEIMQDYADTTNKYNTLTKENEKYKSDNESLRNSNMELFVELGKQNTSLDDKTSPNKKDKKEEDSLKFENLINEKGELV